MAAQRPHKATKRRLTLAPSRATVGASAVAPRATAGRRNNGWDELASLLFGLAVTAGAVWVFLAYLNIV